MKHILLVKYAELNTKKGNKRLFIRKLQRNIQRKIQELGSFLISANSSRLVIEGETEKINEVINKLKNTPGIENIAITDIIANNSIEAIKKQIKNMIPNLRGKTFRINVNRANKKFPSTSMELAKNLGEFVIVNSDLIVDLTTPDHIIFIEIRDSQTFLYSDKIKGIGGLPIGSSGRVLALLSGGIDSPVAIFELLKRGCEVELLHFTSPGSTSSESLEKVKKISKKLVDFSFKIKLHIVNFTEIQNEIYCGAYEKYRIILMRKIFYIIASKIAYEQKCKAIATGESLGQVASQTLESMYATSNNIDNLFLRPLISMNKNDIIKIAKHIGTYDISISEGEDCCSLFVPNKPVIKPKKDDIDQQIDKLMLHGMIERVLKTYQTIIFENKE